MNDYRMGFSSALAKPNHVAMCLYSVLANIRAMSASASLTNTVKGAAGIAVAIALWEGVRAGGLVDPRDLPSTFAIVQAAVRGILGGELLAAILGTMRSWAPGLLIASIIGIAGGVALALMPRFEITVRPLLEFIRPIPSVALIPVALITLGIGLQVQLILIAFASVWPVLFSTKAGVESIDPRFLETGRIFGLSGTAQTWRIVCPGALPSIATGIRTASAIALVLAITVEMLTGQPGIGYYLQFARLNGQITEMWAAILVTGILGFLVNAAFLTVERLLLPWSPENRGS